MRDPLAAQPEPGQMQQLPQGVTKVKKVVTVLVAVAAMAGAPAFAHHSFAMFDGDKLVVLEAMKMLTTVCAGCDGTIVEVLVQKGDPVDSDDLLVKLAAG